MLTVALLLIPGLADMVPARWTSPDPASLQLLEQTAIRCLVLEGQAISKPLVDAARSRQIATLAVVHPGDDVPAAIERANALGLGGVLLEGDFEAGIAGKARRAARDSQLEYVELPARAHVNAASGDAVLGTFEGIWPGIRAEDNAHAAPSSGPWIQSNGACLRFLRQNTNAAVWISVRPPEQVTLAPESYLHAIADAAMTGARWVISFDRGFEQRLNSADAKAQKTWREMAALIDFYEGQKTWREARAAGRFALVQHASSGALYTGGVLDMITSRNTPVRPLLLDALDPVAFGGVKMAVNADPQATGPKQKEVLTSYTRGGGMLLTAPPGWKLPPPVNGEIKLNEEEYKTLDSIWREINTMINRQNLGVRLFNVSGMLSNFAAMASGSPAIVQLVNYTNYPVENVTVHVLGKWAKARVLAPGKPARDLEVYPTEEGTGIDIDMVGFAATLIVE